MFYHEWKSDVRENWSGGRRARRGFICTALLVVMCVLVLASCSDTTTPANPSQKNSATPTFTPVALNTLRWCNKEAKMVFTDDSASVTPTVTKAKPVEGSSLGPANGTPTAIKDWKTLKDNLGITVFLPTTLPSGSCLLSASGSVRNAVYGSNFTLIYVLPGDNSLTLSQAPQSAQNAQNTALQCSSAVKGAENAPATATAAAKGGTPVIQPLQVCTGVRDSTNVTFSARWSVNELQQFFKDLQSDGEWMPAS